MLEYQDIQLGSAEPIDSDAAVTAESLHRRSRISSFSNVSLGSAEIDYDDQPMDSSDAKQGLNTWRLAALTFFTVSGGPYGLEPLVSTIGPFYSIIGLLVVPWIWGLPSALMTAELASALPEMGGYILWVERSMGDFWAFQNAIWNLFTNVLDNSLYPVMFTDYLEQMVGHDFSYFTRSAIGITLVSALGLVNVVGVDIVGDGAGAFGCFVIIPFILMVIVGFSSGEVDPADWSKRIDEPQVGLYVSMLLWNTCGYDSAGTCAAEVENPGKTFPRAMVATIIVSTLLYILPLMVGVSFATDYELWEDGLFVNIGELVGGFWLKLLVLVAGTVSSAGQLNSTICTSSRALACMAGFGYVPRRLSRIHPKYGTPLMAIFINSSCIILMVLTGLDFESIAELSMWLYSLTLGFEFAALVLLRVNEPDLKRPYVIPGGTLGVCLLSIPPLICCAILMTLSHTRTWYLCGFVVLAGVVLLVPFYMFSGRPVQLPWWLSWLIRTFGCYLFSRLDNTLAEGTQVLPTEDAAEIELSTASLDPVTAEAERVRFDVDTIKYI